MKGSKTVCLFGVLFIALFLTSNTFTLAEPTNEIHKGEATNEEIQGNEQLEDILTESDQIGLYYIAQNGQRYCSYGCCGNWYCRGGGGGGGNNNNNNNNNNGGGGNSNNNNNNNNNNNYRRRCTRICSYCCGYGGQFSGSNVQIQP